MLSTSQAATREGDLHQVFHILAFMKNNPKLKIYFDPRFLNIYSMSFSGSSAEVFREQNRNEIQEIPKDMP